MLCNIKKTIIVNDAIEFVHNYVPKKELKKFKITQKILDDGDIEILLNKLNFDSDQDLIEYFVKKWRGMWIVEYIDENNGFFIIKKISI